MRSAPVILGLNESPQRQMQRIMTNLIRVGGKLAVLGADPSSKAAATRWWHIAVPGSYDPPKDNSGTGLTNARALCGRLIVTNGYSADFRPADRVLCPACKERL